MGSIGENVYKRAIPSIASELTVMENRDEASR